MFGGYPPTTIGDPPTAIGYTPTAIVGRIGHSEFFFFITAPPGPHFPGAVKSLAAEAPISALKRPTSSDALTVDEPPTVWQPATGVGRRKVLPNDLCRQARKRLAWGLGLGVSVTLLTCGAFSHFPPSSAYHLSPWRQCFRCLGCPWRGSKCGGAHSLLQKVAHLVGLVTTATTAVIV